MKYVNNDLHWKSLEEAMHHLKMVPPLNKPVLIMNKLLNNDVANVLNGHIDVYDDVPHEQDDTYLMGIRARLEFLGVPMLITDNSKHGFLSDMMEDAINYIEELLDVLKEQQHGN